MAREKGTFNFSANLEVKKQGPLDARQTMITYAELTQAATWQDESGKMYLFNGLIVPVTNGSEKQVYMLIDAAKYNQAASWKRIDAGGAVSKEEVYILPGDLYFFMNNPSPTKEQVAEKIGTYAKLKAVYDAQKVIVGKYLNQLTVFAYKEVSSSSGSEVLLTSFVSEGTGLVVFHFKYSNNEWVDSGTKTETFEMINKVSATPNKGIEIGGDARNVQVGLKIDEKTKGNVSLSVGENGLKAEFDEKIYILPGDILTLTEETEEGQAIAILGTAQNWKKAFDAKKVFVSNTSIGLITLNPYLYGFSVFYYENNKPILLHVSLQDDGGGGNWMTTPVSEIIKSELAENNNTVQSVTATTNKGIEIGGTATKPTVGVKLDTATPGNVDLAVGANGLKATLSSKAVKSSDKVLKVESDKSISATVSLGYNSETKKLQLKGVNEEVFNELDATPFIKDGMLDSATLEVNPSGQSTGTYIKLVFNTESGKDPIYINVTSLIDVYTQGNGISISGKTIAVKLDETGNSEGYLKLTAAGLKVEGVNAAVAAAIAEAFSWHDA